MNNRRTFFIMLIFLTTIIACAVPGLPTASAPAPAPIVDTGRLETMVAETVSAAIAQTEQVRPTPTLVPVSRSTQTATRSAEAATSGSTLTTHEDDSTIFVDERAGYEITLPDGWLAVRINEQEYYDAWTLAEAADPNIQETLLGIKTEDPNVFRLLAIDTQDGHIQSEFVTDIHFIWDEQMSFDSIEDLQTIANEIPNASTAFRFEVTSVQTIMAPNGIQFGMIEAKSSFTNASGDVVNIYQKQVFFKAKTGTQSIIFTTIDGLKETTLPAFDAMIETISLIAE